MRLVDIDQTIFIPIVDESKGGVEYEMQMTVWEFFKKFCEGFEPEIIDISADIAQKLGLQPKEGIC